MGRSPVVCALAEFKPQTAGRKIQSNGPKLVHTADIHLHLSPNTLVG